MKHNTVPVKNRIAKTPVIMQLEMLECGAACLSMILAYYGKWLPLEQVRKDCGVSRDGSSAGRIVKAAMNYGLKYRAKRYNAETLRKHGSFPCIVFWNSNHFVVVNGFSGNRVSVNDPAEGQKWVDAETFKKSYCEIALMFEPGTGFMPEGKPKSTFRYAMSRIRKSGAAYIFILIITVISSLIVILEQGFSRFFMDRILMGKDTNLLPVLSAAMLILCAFKIIMDIVYSKYNNRIECKMYVEGSASYVYRLLRLPLEFFAQRNGSDLLNRKTSNSQIAGNLVNIFAPLLLQAVMMVFYLIAMFRYNVWMAAIGIVSVIINIIITGIVNRKYINLSRNSVQSLNALNTETIHGIEMIETIKASGNENGSFAIWAGAQAAFSNVSVKLQRLQMHFGFIPGLVNEMTGLLILGIGAYLTMQGSFSVGMIMAFSGFLSCFAGPAENLVKAGQSVQQMSVAIERVEDVLAYPEDEMVTDYSSSEGICPVTGKLAGKIEIRDLVFSYGRFDVPVLNGISIKVNPGDNIAIVGRSGCGKSTISKILCGLYQPSSGEILLDGMNIKDISRDVFCSSVGLVDQNIALFSDSVLNNITLWDETIPFSDVEKASRDACIHSEIMERSGGYHVQMAENGKNFSGGQRQRIEIARVLAANPSVIILDEATSALDAKTESLIASAIRNRHITSIIIAHRLSTIRDCDRIYVLDDGKIAEQGTHDELYKMGGIYKELVISE